VQTETEHDSGLLFNQSPAQRHKEVSITGGIRIQDGSSSAPE